VKNQKPEPKKGGSKIDALRTERERQAADREAKVERQKSCRHPRTEPKMSGISVCLVCGAVVEKAAT
jgi:hypothetical protein